MKLGQQLATTVLVGWLALISGCGAAKPVVRDNVSGVVKLSGRIFEHGLVTLHGPDGKQASASILSGGRYLIDDPPLGLCQVTVTPPPGFANANFDANADPHAPPKEQASPIPAKYRTPGNGLSVEVKAGATVYNIEMN